MISKCIHNEKVSLVLFFVTVIIYSLIYMTKNCYSAAMVLLVNEGILTKTQTGTISAVFYLVYAPFQLVGGIAADKYSPFKLISIGVIGAAFCNLAIIFANNYYAMLLIWAFNGAIQFGVWPAVFKICASVLSPVHRRNAVFYSTFTGTIGSALSYFIAGFVSTWRTNFVISSIVLFACSFLWVLSYPYFKSRLRDEDDYSHGVAHMPEVPKAQKSLEGGSLKLIVISGVALALLPIIINSMFAFGVQSLVPTMINESYESVSPSIASFLALFPIIFAVAGKFAIQNIYKKKTYNESLALCITTLIMAIPLFVMTFVGKINYFVIIAMFSLVVAISGASGIITMTYIPLRFAKFGKVGTMSGLMNSMSALGIVCASYISPLIADTFGGWFEVTVSWLIFALFAVFIFFLTFFPWTKFISQKND